MNDRMKAWSAGILLACAAAAACRARALPPRTGPGAAMEAFLRKADIIQVDREPRMGRTDAWLVTMKEGTVGHRALFKTVRRSRPALMPDSYAYELAAYELDKLLGLGLVPVAVERTIQGRTGSLQFFLEGAETEKSRLRKNLVPPDPQAYQDRLDEIEILEHLVCAPRQDLGDIIFQSDAWRPWRVDFSEAFRPVEEMLPDCEVKRCSRRVFSALSVWEDARVQEVLTPYLNSLEISALLKRRALIIKEVKRLIAERGEAAVLYLP